MTRQHTQAGYTYHVTVSREDDSHAHAHAREHTLALNIKKGDGTAGFNAAETLLAALGTCILTKHQQHFRQNAPPDQQRTHRIHRHPTR